MTKTETIMFDNRTLDVEFDYEISERSCLLEGNYTLYSINGISEEYITRNFKNTVIEMLEDIRLNS